MLYLTENADIRLLRRLKFEHKAQLPCKITLMGHSDKKFIEHNYSKNYIKTRWLVGEYFLYEVPSQQNSRFHVHFVKYDSSVTAISTVKEL
jgi:FAD synthase